MNNLFLTNVYFVGNMTLLGLFYISILKFKKHKVIVKWSLSVVLLVLIIQFFMDYSQFLRFNLFEITITSLLTLFFALLHFYNLLTEKREYYYISVGVIIYLFTSTVLFLVGNLTDNLNNDWKYVTWTLNAVLYVVYQLFILYEWKVSFSKKAITKN